MVPGRIPGAGEEEAVQVIIDDRVPPPGSGRGDSLSMKGVHLPPKQTMSVAHQAAKDELPSPDQSPGDSG